MNTGGSFYLILPFILQLINGSNITPRSACYRFEPLLKFVPSSFIKLRIRKDLFYRL